MKVISFLLVVLCLTGFAAYAALDLSEIGVGARPLGMGRAYVGAADDASSIFINPAGLSRNNNLNVISMSGQMLGDVNYLLLGAADNSPIGKIGIGYIAATTGSIPVTTLEGSGASLEARQTAVVDYSSSIFFISYGSKLGRFLRGKGDNFSLGASLKLFLQGFTGGRDPVTGWNPMENANGSGMDADLGLQWEPNAWTTLGLTFQNFLPDNFGGKFTWQKNSIIEGIPMVTRLGGKFSILGLSALRRDEKQKLDLVFDYESMKSGNRPSVFHAGVEYHPLGTLALRAGIDQKPKATENGIGTDNNLTGGVGFYLSGFTFDYAYHQFGDLTENTTHFFSIGYRGADREKDLIRAKVEKRKPTIPLPEVVSKPAFKTFPDVPAGYWASKPIEHLAALGIMDSYNDGTFRPTKEITRGELAVLLVKAKGFSVGKEIKKRFSDVSLQSYEAPYVSVAVEREYILGFPDGKFKPEKRVTRAEAAQILARFSGIYQKPKLNSNPFPDIAVNHWAAPAIAATKETGLFEYLAGQGFGPNLYLTRAEAAEIISKTPFAKKQIEKLIGGGGI